MRDAVSINRATQIVDNRFAAGRRLFESLNGRLDAEEQDCGCSRAVNSWRRSLRLESEFSSGQLSRRCQNQRVRLPWKSHETASILFVAALILMKLRSATTTQDAQITKHTRCESSQPPPSSPPCAAGLSLGRGKTAQTFYWPGTGLVWFRNMQKH